MDDTADPSPRTVPQDVKQDTFVAGEISPSGLTPQAELDENADKVRFPDVQTLPRRPSNVKHAASDPPYATGRRPSVHFGAAFADRDSRSGSRNAARTESGARRMSSPPPPA